MNTKLILVLIVIFSFHHSDAQTLDWLKYFDRYSFGYSINQTASGKYILSGSYGRDNCMSSMFDNNGYEIWQDSIWNCQRPFIFSTELKDGRLLHISSLGDVIVSDSNGKNADSIYNLRFTSIYERLDRGFQFDSILILIGYGNLNGKNGTTKYYINLNNLNIQSQVFDSLNSNLKTLHYFNDGSLLECFSWSGFQYLKRSDKDGNQIWRKAIALKDIQINDMLVTNNQSIYLDGYIDDSTKQRLADALLIKLNSVGEILWTKTYKASFSGHSTNDVKIFGRIKSFNENEFIIAGTDGFVPVGPVTKLSIMNIDSMGDINWEFLKQGSTEGSAVIDFVINKEKDIIAVGTIGESDFGESERALILKIKSPITKTKHNFRNEFEIFPNPTQNTITLKSNDSVEGINIFLMNTLGEIVFRSKWQSEIDLSSFSSGNYTLLVQSAELRQFKKVTLINN